MKKISLILVVFIVLAQLAWLSVQYDTLSFELDNAPRIRVKGSFAWLSVRVTTTRSQLGGDDDFFGRSLWWDSERWETSMRATQTSTEAAISPREKTDESALELLPHAYHKLAGFWKRGEDGIWQLCRVEAPGSKEATCRPGEVYTPVSMYSSGSIKPDSAVIDLELAFAMSPDTSENNRSRVEYALNPTLRRWMNAHPENELTLEIALRDKRPPLATQLFIGGKPYAEVIKDAHLMEAPDTECNAAPAGDEQECQPEEAAEQPTPTEEPTAEQPTPTEEPAAEQPTPAEDSAAQEAPTPEEIAPPTPAESSPAPEAPAAEPEVEKAG